MKTLTRVLAVVLLTASFLTAQNSPQFGGRIYASQYGKYQIGGETITTASGAATLSFAPSKCIQSAGNRPFIPFTTTNPLKIVDATSSNTETVTPSAVSVSAGSCSFTATFSNAHASYYVTSGTGGLQEAITDNASSGGMITLDSGSTTTDANIRAAVGAGSNLAIEDLRSGPARFWALRPTAVTQIAAPAAPTVTAISGSLSSGAYLTKVAYVDAFGGVSLPSAEPSATATTTGLSIASPAASAGAVGWLPYITAAGGGANSEILAASPLTAAICGGSLTTLETIIPACPIGNAATITAANPSATAKPVVESTAYTTATFQPFQGALPTPFVNNYTFGTFVASATLNNSNADLAQFQIPAGFFNDLNHGALICVKAATATAVASSVPVMKLQVANEYAQSPVAVSTITFATQTRAAAGTIQGCWLIETSTTGASGKFWARDTGNWVQFLNSAPATQVISADASAAASSAVDLTKLTWWSINLSETGSQNLTGPIVNSVTITPIGG